LLASKEKQDEIAKKYRAGSYWYWHAKEELFNIFLEYFREAREKYKKFEKNMSYIYKKLEEWNKEANLLADDKYKKMIKLVGLANF
jgi:tryptophanyl-tRNA synthetase